MRQVIVNRAEWARGGQESGYMNQLLGNGTHAGQCCVGIYLTACGVPDSQLLDVGGAVQINTLPEEAKWLVSKTNYDTGCLYQLNDKNVTFDASEDKIAAIFTKHDVEMIFVGEGHPRK